MNSIHQPRHAEGRAGCATSQVHGADRRRVDAKQIFNGERLARRDLDIARVILEWTREYVFVGELASQHDRQV